ncbi:MAG: aconitase X catalytic domain-containing protein [Candidatus Freyarchaeota archaeon]|nr:aconitase X catalytic domain-containing protein [Candidatus Jordarchaeia archaeon]
MRTMYLTNEEEKALDGEHGEVVSLAMRILCALGDFFEADRLIPVQSAHVSGVSYKTGGEALLTTLRKFSSMKAKALVPTTLNPGGVDLERWREMGVEEEFFEKQKKIISFYTDMGILATCSCTPYEAGNLPARGAHVAFAESSAVAFINSYLGARTNRESGLSALASAITGKTPCYGLHVDGNRRPTVKVKVTASLESPTHYGALGYLIGKNFGDAIPLIQSGRPLPLVEAKHLSSAAAASGAIALYYWGEAPGDSDLEKVEVDGRSLAEVFELFGLSEEPEVIVLGCPHYSIHEMRKVAEMVEGRWVKTPLWIFTSRQVRHLGEQLGLVQKIEQAGGKVFCDTCPIVAPLKGFRNLLTDSAKAAHYAPSMNKMESALLSTDGCVRVALRGVQ